MIPCCSKASWDHQWHRSVCDWKVKYACAAKPKELFERDAFECQLWLFVKKAAGASLSAEACRLAGRGSVFRCRGVNELPPDASLVCSFGARSFSTFITYQNVNAWCSGMAEPIASFGILPSSNATNSVRPCRSAKTLYSATY